MTVLAGSAAVRRALGDASANATPDVDYRAALELARECFMTVEEAETFVAHLEDETAVMLSEPRRWECVETFAEVLLNHGAVNGREARYLFQQVILGTPRPSEPFEQGF